MTLKKRVAIAGLALSTLAVPLAADARAYVDIQVAPPPPRVEVVPAPRAGYVWAPGYWAWRGGQHVWIPGRWVGARRGYRWEPAHWVQWRGRWRFVEGRWVR